MVANYTYDAWGKLLSVTDANGAAITNASHIANLNPIRYRSYFYDVQTGFYYLKTRYYNPQWGRFLNADSQLDFNAGVIGYNLYAYCANNPVNFNDPTGRYIVLSGDRIQVEKGDSLWSIAASLTGNGSNWTYFGYTGDPSKLQVGYILNAASLPKKGNPNSKDTLYNPNGTPKQERTYGPNGEPVKDRDYNHGGNHDFPHDHEWNNGVRGPALPVPKPKSDAGKGIAVGVGAVGVGYLFYRGIRMLPSLFPALWCTLPANVLVP